MAYQSILASTLYNIHILWPTAQLYKSVMQGCILKLRSVGTHQKN